MSVYIETTLDPSVPAIELRKGIEHLHWALHGVPIVVRNSSGGVVVLELGEQHLAEKGIVTSLSQEEINEQLRSSVPRLGNILDAHRADYSSESPQRFQSVSWWAAHSLWHLRDSGARQHVREVLGLDIDEIERSIEKHPGNGVG